jgi:hypothetical protein
VTGRRAALLASAVGLLAFAAPCGAGPEPPAAAGLELRLEIQDAEGRSARSFATGAPVGLVLEVRNAGSTPQRLEFPSGKTHDFAVSDARGREVWRWSSGRMFALMLSELELAPGESRSYAEPWDQRDAGGAPVAAGRYQVVASLACTPAPPPAGPVAFEID